MRYTRTTFVSYKVRMPDTPYIFRILKLAQILLIIKSLKYWFIFFSYYFIYVYTLLWDYFFISKYFFC